MKSVVVDTHAIVWYFTGDPRLPETAHRLLEDAERGDGQVLVPTIVLAESAHIAQRKKAPVPIEKVVSVLREENGFAVVPFDFEIFSTVLRLPAEWELHDRIIAATAKYYRAALLTKDRVLRDARDLETIW
ncbi:MAG: type II toxin-antitoxin system VapC family toxin [Deltaproteobacteria bacterium]|nr:type II toxin-antitoxin system VapC family toxin [Deltaproteobacteria bacterium]